MLEKFAVLIANYLFDKIEERLIAYNQKMSEFKKIEHESEGLMLELKLSQTEEEYYAVLKKINAFANLHGTRK